jgi:hypothetical protein
MLNKPGDIQIHNGKSYIINEVGGIDLFNKEPTLECPYCKETAYADWTDNGFGPYSVQTSPYHCYNCGWIQE